MREVNLSLVTEGIKKACINSNKILPEDLEQRIKYCTKCEKTEPAHSVMTSLKIILMRQKPMIYPSVKIRVWR